MIDRQRSGKVPIRELLRQRVLCLSPLSPQTWRDTSFGSHSIHVPIDSADAMFLAFIFDDGIISELGKRWRRRTHCAIRNIG